MVVPRNLNDSTAVTSAVHDGKRRLAASFEKTAQSDCHWCLNEMKVGAKRKKQDIRLFFQTVSK